MSLEVFTAPIAYVGRDRLNITRKSGGPEGLPFAPSWASVLPVLRARSGSLEAEAGAWERYVQAYAREMHTSQRTNPRPWRNLLARELVTLVCYCRGRPPQLRCHRVLLAELLQAQGAHYRGER